MGQFRTLFFIFILITPSQSVIAQTQTFMSGKKQTALLELYTSEGCSSCPAADRWLSALKEEKGLWRDFIPLAFHVDYWDFIGWKDKFAQPKYAKRQRQYALDHSLTTVYTPGFIYGGMEWRNWSIKKLRRLYKAASVGELELVVDNNQFNLRFTPTQVQSETYEFNIALLGFNLKTSVNRGENTGKVLHHDFIVLALKQGAMLKIEEGAKVSGISLPAIDLKSKPVAVVAWVNHSNRQTPIQSVGGYLKSTIKDSDISKIFIQ